MSEQKINLLFRWITFLALPLSGAGVDIYTPSLPTIVHAFHTTAATSQLTITTYILGFGIAQLASGPVSDYMGRKMLILLSLALFCASSLLIAFTTNIGVLLALRCVQGIFVGGVAVPARAIIADLYSGKEFRRKTNYMVLSWALGPIIAPWIGSHLLTSFDWQANFYFLSAYSFVILMIVIFWYRETLPKTKRSKSLHIFSSYRQIFGSTLFVASFCVMSFVYAFLIFYNMVAPFIITNKLHMSALVFGRTALLMGAGWALGSLINRLTDKMSIRTKLSAAQGLLFALTIFMWIESSGQAEKLWILIVPTFLMVTLGSMCFSTLTGRALAEFTHIAGAANAALFAFMWVGISILTFICTNLHIQNTSGLSVTYIATIAISMLIYLVFIRKPCASNP